MSDRAYRDVVFPLMETHCAFRWRKLNAITLIVQTRVSPGTNWDSKSASRQTEIGFLHYETKCNIGKVVPVLSGATGGKESVQIYCFSKNIAYELSW